MYLGACLKPALPTLKIQQQQQQQPPELTALFPLRTKFPAWSTFLSMLSRVSVWCWMSTARSWNMDATSLMDLTSISISLALLCASR